MLTVALVNVNHPPQLQERLHPQAAMETLPRSKLNKIRSRKSESSDYGGSSERHNHGARYISHQIYSVLIILCYLFLSIPENLGTTFMLRGVVLSHPKIPNFGM
jgi:hypothetical protein